MSSSTCDSKRVFEIIGESAYKAVLFDSFTELSLRGVGAIPTMSPGISFAGGLIGYSIRGIARDCLSEYTHKVGDYSIAPYIGAVLGGGLKYLVKGYNALTNSKAIELFTLGSINAVGYEWMTDFQLDTITSVTTSVLLEVSEVFTPLVFRPLEGNIKKNVLIYAGAALMVSAEIEWLYTPIKKQAEAWYEVINTNIPAYEEINSEARALCHKAGDYVVSLIGSNHTSFDIDHKEL